MIFFSRVLKDTLQQAIRSALAILHSPSSCLCISISLSAKALPPSPPTSYHVCFFPQNVCRTCFIERAHSHLPNSPSACWAEADGIRILQHPHHRRLLYNAMGSVPFCYEYRRAWREAQGVCGGRSAQTGIAESFDRHFRK